MRKSLSNDATITQPLSQSTAILLIILIVGASIYLWHRRYLRSRAGLIAIAMIVAGLALYAYTTDPIMNP